MLVQEAARLEYRFHVLDFHWEGFTPRLEAYDAVRKQPVELPLDTLSLTVSEERRCVGIFNDDHIPCPSRRRVGRLTQCRECMGDWAEVVQCVFEPKCNGEECAHRDFCGRRHVVYLAAYGTLVKVGMTSAGRLERRGIEQGADAIMPVLMCPDRQEARRLEKETSRRFKLPQEIRAARIAAQWTHPPSRELIANNFSTYRRRIGAWREAMDAEIVFLDGYPVHEHPRTPPRVVVTAGRHAGEVLGIKGRYMVFRDAAGEHGLLDLSDLPSRLVDVPDPTPPGRGHRSAPGKAHAPPRHAQSTLDL